MNSGIRFVIRLLFFGISLCLFNSSFAEIVDVKRVFQRINTLDGLSNNWVRCFYQDELGFIWIGTADGLNRYDGHDIKVYRAIPSGSDSGIGTTVNSISYKSPNELWISTDVGVYIYNYGRDRLEQFDSVDDGPVFHVFVDSNQRFWVATQQGTYMLDSVDLAVNDLDKSLLEKMKMLHNAYTNEFFEDSQHRLWVCSKEGLKLFRENDGDAQALEDDSMLDVGLPRDAIAIAEDGQGRIWVGYAHGGVHLLSPEGDTFRIDRIAEGDIIELVVDKDDILWIARGADGGLLKLDLKSFDLNKELHFERMRSDRSDPNSIGDSSLFSVFEDRSGGIWVGAFGNGISYTSKRFKPISLVHGGPGSIPNSLVNVLFEEEEALWIGTETGLSRYDRSSGEYLNLNEESDVSLGSDAVFDILRDSRGYLWVGFWRGGLARIDRDGIGVKRFFPSGQKGGLPTAHVFSIYEDRRGDLWLGFIGGGFARYDYDSETFEPIPQASTRTGPNSVNDLLETEDGTFYVSGYDSLALFDRESLEIKDFLHKPQIENGNNGSLIVSLFEDSYGLLWIATEAGLELFDKDTGTFINYTIEEGGTGGSGICGILEDAERNLWISGVHGLAKFVRNPEDPKSGEFRVISYGHGISGSEFKKRAAHVGVDGQMYFGTSKGYLHFDPDIIEFNDIEPHAVISDVSILISVPDRPSVYQGIGHENIEEGVLKLSYKSADVRFKFAALSYLNPEANRYKYRLLGYDRDWIDAGHNNIAHYTSIDPGEYVFEVLCSNNDGVWSSKSEQLRIMINPPWWDSNWFRLVIAIAFFLAIIAGLRLRDRMQIKRQRELRQLVDQRTTDLLRANELLGEKQSLIEMRNTELASHKASLESKVIERTSELEIAKKMAEDSDRLKSAFLANLSHEIRTPMNAIVGFSSLLKSNLSSPEEMDTHVDIITDNCRSLLVLIDDILDLSLINSGQMEIVKDSCNVDAMIDGLFRFYALKEDKNLSVSMELDNSDGPLWLETDGIRLKQVFSNLLGNAYKFTESGEIVIGYRRHEDGVHFFVKDTGTGIDSTNLDRIFDRFYKVEASDDQLFRGTGLGLAICSEIIRLLGGQIGVDSVVGEGSTFHFELPNDYVVPISPQIVGNLENPNFEDLVILIVEDEETNYLLIQLHIEKAGAKSAHAWNGVEALDYISSPDRPKRLLVLMDINMPKMDGCEACERIKALDPSIPIIAQTAFAQAKEKERIMSGKFDAYIAKPIDPPRLLQMIAQYQPPV